jgi:hypothetical protein
MEAYSIFLLRFYPALTPTFASHFDLEVAITVTAGDAGVTTRFRG